MIAIRQQEPAINNKALAWTIGVHALLLLLFFVLRYTISPIPPPQLDGGLEVNLGTSDNGSGNDQPMSTKDPAAYQASVVYKSVAAKSDIPKEIVRSNQEDAPEVNETKKAKKIAPSDVKPIEKPKPAVPQNPKYSYSGEHGAGGNSAAQNKPGTSEGNTTGPGDRGVPGGTPGAANYSGIPGNGNGGRLGHNLSGREIFPKSFEAEFNEGGRVVVHVVVDKNGTITTKQLKISSGNAKLDKMALEKLSAVHFSKSNGLDPEQSGDITFNFTTR
jgi:TonB family protein